ncbi:hypothetical protein Clacol_004329 [Clathrus columnatus]|uniref:Uncharacterized protein n=1 Tax=Clathrus columnatus TaxID=1419009 RepID=A0AAV5AA96_9AGAM|nr:hypothetical protein Clacol_004329 [Clathrus columnatus]
MDNQEITQLLKELGEDTKQGFIEMRRQMDMLEEKYENGNHAIGDDMSIISKPKGGQGRSGNNPKHPGYTLWKSMKAFVRAECSRYDLPLEGVQDQEWLKLGITCKQNARKNARLDGITLPSSDRKEMNCSRTHEVAFTPTPNNELTQLRNPKTILDAFPDTKTFEFLSDCFEICSQETQIDQTAIPSASQPDHHSRPQYHNIVFMDNEGWFYTYDRDILEVSYNTTTCTFSTRDELAELVLDCAPVDMKNPKKGLSNIQAKNVNGHWDVGYYVLSILPIPISAFEITPVTSPLVDYSTPASKTQIISTPLANVSNPVYEDNIPEVMFFLTHTGMGNK